MRVEQVQVDVDRLVKGMYVCALDRPWLSTPFPFQGFVIRSEEEIAQLRQYCNYVYVDVLRGVPPSEDDTHSSRSWRRDEKKDDEEPTFSGGKPAAEKAPKKAEKDKEAEAEQDDEAQYSEDGQLRRTDIKVVPIKVHPDYYESPKNFRKEMRRAQQLHQELTRATGQVIDDIRVGRGLDGTSIRRATKNMIHSVIRHPDAFVWMTKLRDKDSYSYAHSVRSSVLSVVFARQIGMQEHQMENLALGTLLCEVGKAKLPKQLLEKQDPLDDIEMEKVRSHVKLGVEILDRCVGIGDDVVEIVENHHERFNGTGYPEGRTGDQIPLHARIAGLVDVYDAMTSVKPYTHQVFSTSQAMDWLYDRRDVLFQSQLVEEFIQALGIYPTGTQVELNTGEVGIILTQNTKQRIQPEILVVLDQNKRPLPKYQKRNLREHNAKNPDMPVSIKRALTAGEYGLDPNQIMVAHSDQKWDWRKLAFGN